MIKPNGLPTRKALALSLLGLLEFMAGLALVSPINQVSGWVLLGAAMAGSGGTLIAVASRMKKVPVGFDPTLSVQGEVVRKDFVPFGHHGAIAIIVRVGDEGKEQFLHFSDAGRDNRLANVRQRDIVQVRYTDDFLDGKFELVSIEIDPASLRSNGRTAGDTIAEAAA